MARVLLVGCGCRGQRLAERLVLHGHQVRGTTRTPRRFAAIESCGAEAVIADPNRLGTLTCHLPGVSVVCLLLASAEGTSDAVRALHLERFPTLVQSLVDTPVRGVVYEGAGAASSGVLAQGAAAVAHIASTHRMPAEIVTANPAEHRDWLGAMTDAVGSVLSQ